MKPKNTRFQRKLIAVAVASCAMSGLSMSVQAQQAPQSLEEVVVVGVRAAQESAVNTKRDAVSVVDGISAEDIGKLPDVTISDSLQRIPGVQIRRSAGEGSAINVRGLPQVVSQLNGEQYLGANSVTSNQPNFGDIPSHLFRGADVYKSPTANLGSAGITGTVNLKTFRPFDFDEGLTSAVGVEVQTGEETQETDPVMNGLVSWNNDGVGFMLSGSYANVNLANYYNGVNGGGGSGDTGWVGNTTQGLDGELDGTYVAPHGYAAWNNVVERERIGLNASFQADLGGGFEFIADVFYTEQDEYDRKVGLSHTNKWQSQDFFQPTITNDTGVDNWRTFQQATVEGVRLKSFTQNNGTFSSSQNVNLELNYDNGGPFTGGLRYVQGRADQRSRHGYNEGDLTDGSTTGINPYYPDTGFTSPNPNGYSENPRTQINTQGEHMHWSGFDNPLAGGGSGSTIADYMADVNSYNIGAYSSENNFNRNGDMDIFRADGSYAFDEGIIRSVDFGFRNSQRKATNYAYQLTHGLYEDEAFYLSEDGDINNPDDWQDQGNVGGCQVQWKATDVTLGEGPGFCNAGEIVDGEFQGYTALPPTALNAHADVQWVTDFGPVTGVPGVWAVNPEAYDDPEAFHNEVFGENSAKQVIPGQSYDVTLNEVQTYFQVNFEQGIASGNVGARVVNTDLRVRQNEVAGKIPYGNLNEDVGDIYTDRSYTDVLPAANLSLDLREDLILRFAYSENMVPLDLSSWGESLVLDYTIDTSSGDPETDGKFIVSGGSQGGDASFDPWRSNNYDVSLEWYTGPGSMVNIGYFLVEVDSFMGGGSQQQFQPDADGEVRRQVSVNVPTQGEGGELEGFEFGFKQALTFLPSFWSNFGVDANYTLSLSEQEDEDVYGDKLAFPDNSEHQANLIGWYQGERFQARVAYNYRSERLHSTGQAWSNLATYQDAIGYVDVSASYDLTDEVTVYVNGSNVTGEFDDYYLQWEDQYATQSYYEPRWSAGVRARF